MKTVCFALASCVAGSAAQEECAPVVDPGHLRQLDLEAITLDEGLDYLRSLVQTAISRVEHFTLPPYISAMYSLRSNSNKDAHDLIHSVLMEEMVHLADAANLLNAVGGHPCIDKPGFAPEFPQHMEYLDLTGHIAPFSRATIETFAKIESPDFNRTGHTVATLYTTAGELLDDLVSKYGEAAVLTGNRNLQVDWNTPRGKAKPIYSNADAQRVIEAIVEQGEGDSQHIDDKYPFSGRDDLAHYFRFNEILQGRFYADGDKPSAPPSGNKMNVDWADVYDFEPNPKAADYQAYPEIYVAMMQFNACYSDMLAKLNSAANGSPKGFNKSVKDMKKLGKLAQDLMETQSPLDPSKSVGPPWELLNLTESNYQCGESFFRV